MLDVDGGGRPLARFWTVCMAVLGFDASATESKSSFCSAVVAMARRAPSATADHMCRIVGLRR